MKTITQSFKIIALALILSLGVSYVSAWTAPTVAPTGGNATSPLNTSANNQFKSGTLTLTRTDAVQGLEAYGTTLLATITGNVGIGTTAPGTKLQVHEGDITISRSGTNQPLLQWYRSGATANNKYWRAIAANDNNFYFQTVDDAYTAAATAMQIERSGNSIVDTTFPTGNVGIGTTAPYSKLTVGTGASAVSVGQTDTTTGAWIRNDGANTVMSTNTGNMYYGWGGSDKNLYFYSGGTANPALTITTIDRVGLGTTAPSNKLDITTVANSSGIALNGKTALTASAADTWLRLNNDNQFASGVYTPGNMIADGGFSTTWTVAPPAGGIYSEGDIKTLGHVTGTFGAVWEMSAGYFSGTFYSNSSCTTPTTGGVGAANRQWNNGALTQSNAYCKRTLYDSCASLDANGWCVGGYECDSGFGGSGTSGSCVDTGYDSYGCVSGSSSVDSAFQACVWS